LFGAVMPGLCQVNEEEAAHLSRGARPVEARP
jgi:hypothetical protein